MNKNSCIFFVICVLFGFANAVIPDYIHVCHRTDPQVSQCILNSVEALRPRLIQGIPEIGVPGIDPFKLDKIVIFDGVQSPMLDAYLENVEATGAGNFKITKLKLDVDKMTYRVGVEIPFLDMTGRYNINAQILATPIKSDGPFHANATGIDGQVLIQGAIGDGNRMIFQSIAFKINIKDFNLNMENLLNNDPVLSQAARQLLSSNKKDLIDVATPYIERRCEEIFLRLANQITKNFNYDEIFPV